MYSHASITHVLTHLNHTCTHTPQSHMYSHTSITHVLTHLNHTCTHTPQSHMYSHTSITHVLTHLNHTCTHTPQSHMYSHTSSSQAGLSGIQSRNRADESAGNVHRMINTLQFRKVMSPSGTLMEQGWLRTAQANSATKN